MLYRCGTELFADDCQILFALSPIVVEDADFDQFMAVQVGAYLVQNRVRKPVLTDDDDWIQGVGTSPQGTSLVSANIKHSVNPGK